MKTFLTLILIAILLGLVYIFAFPYKTQNICFGKNCPDVGNNTYLMYKYPYSRYECIKKNAYPIEGDGNYIGCAPVDPSVIEKPCPDSKVVDEVSGGDTANLEDYYLVNGKRVEIKDYPRWWIITNCRVPVEKGS